MVSFGSDDNKHYSDYDTGIQYITYTMFSTSRTVKKDLPTYDWQLTRDTKKILGLEVRKATAKLDNNSIIAWYAPKIPYKAGPEDVWGLPGLILEYKLNNNDYEIHVFAKELDYLEGNNVKIKFPDDSEAISQEEYQKQIMEEAKKMEEMYSQGVDTSD
nr:GLPGLI family protein [Profundicola chukchiensis]